MDKANPNEHVERFIGIAEQLDQFISDLITKNAELSAENGRLKEVIEHGFFATTIDGVMYSKFGDDRTFWCIYRYCPDDGEWLLGECHPIRDYDEYELMQSVGCDKGFVVEEAEDECYFYQDSVYFDKAKAEAAFAALSPDVPESEEK